jgi:hypothetical protein
MQNSYENLLCEFVRIDPGNDRPYLEGFTKVAPTLLLRWAKCAIFTKNEVKALRGVERFITKIIATKKELDKRRKHLEQEKERLTNKKTTLKSESNNLNREINSLEKGQTINDYGRRSTKNDELKDRLQTLRNKIAVNQQSLDLSDARYPIIIAELEAAIQRFNEVEDIYNLLQKTIWSVFAELKCDCKFLLLRLGKARPIREKRFLIDYILVAMTLRYNWGYAIDWTDAEYKTLVHQVEILRKLLAPQTAKQIKREVQYTYQKARDLICVALCRSLYSIPKAPYLVRKSSVKDPKFGFLKLGYFYSEFESYAGSEKYFSGSEESDADSTTKESDSVCPVYDSINVNEDSSNYTDTLKESKYGNNAPESTKSVLVDTYIRWYYTWPPDKLDQVMCWLSYGFCDAISAYEVENNKTKPNNWRTWLPIEGAFALHLQRRVDNALTLGFNKACGISDRLNRQVQLIKDVQDLIPKEVLEHLPLTDRAAIICDEAKKITNGERMHLYEKAKHFYRTLGKADPSKFWIKETIVAILRKHAKLTVDAYNLQIPTEKREEVPDVVSMLLRWLRMGHYQGFRDDTGAEYKVNLQSFLETIADEDSQSNRPWRVSSEQINDPTQETTGLSGTNDFKTY